MKHLWIASTWINALLKEFESYGLDIPVLTKGISGFDNGRFSAEDRLDLLSARLLWLRAEDLSGDPLLGARIGLSSNYRSVGVIAPLIWHSDSIALAMQNVSKYQSLISENGAFRIENDLDGIHINCIYEETPAALKSSVQQILSVTVASIQIIRDLTSGRVKVHSLTVPHGTPVSGLKGLLELDVVSAGDVVSVKIAKENLMDKISGCDTALYSLCLEYANSLVNEKKEGSVVIQTIRRYIAGHGMAAAEISGCAEQMNTYPRNLQRQLESFGTSFRKIKDEVLKERTIAELNNKSEIKDIAEAIGYSELSGFYRAFKSWFGITPKKALKEGVISVESIDND